MGGGESQPLQTAGRRQERRGGRGEALNSVSAPPWGFQQLTKFKSKATSLLPHFTCSRSFRPPWPRPWLATAPAGHPAPERSSRLRPPASARLGSAGAVSVSRALSARSPVTPPSRHPGKVQGAWDPAGLQAPQAAQGSNGSPRLAPLDPPAPAPESGARGGAAHARTPGARPATGCLVPHL